MKQNCQFSDGAYFPPSESSKPDSRKALGRLGEELVDEWAQSLRWFALHKNHHWRGGEVDRIYTRAGVTCGVEIKTQVAWSNQRLQDLQSEEWLRACMRSEQLQRLWNFTRQVAQNTETRISVVRVFICKGKLAVQKTERGSLVGTLLQERFLNVPATEESGGKKLRVLLVRINPEFRSQALQGNLGSFGMVFD